MKESNCPICRSRRYNAYARFGEVYNSKGNKKPESINVVFCEGCKALFDQDDQIIIQYQELLTNLITGAIANQVDQLTLLAVKNRESIPTEKFIVRAEQLREHLISNIHGIFDSVVQYTNETILNAGIKIEEERNESLKVIATK